MQVGLAVLEGVEEVDRGSGSIGDGSGRVGGLASLEGADEVSILLYDKVDHLALFFRSASLEFELAFARLGGLFASPHACSEFVRAICDVFRSVELVPCMCEFSGALEEGVLCEGDLVGDASECEGEFLYLRNGRVGWYVRVCAEGLYLMGETGVLLLEDGGVLVYAQRIKRVTLQLDGCCVCLVLYVDIGESVVLRVTKTCLEASGRLAETVELDDEGVLVVVVHDDALIWVLLC